MIHISIFILWRVIKHDGSHIYIFELHVLLGATFCLRHFQVGKATFPAVRNSVGGGGGGGGEYASLSLTPVVCVMSQP